MLAIFVQASTQVRQLNELFCGKYICMWVRSLMGDCLVTWFCYHLIAKPGNKTATSLWPDPCMFFFVYLRNENILGKLRKWFDDHNGKNLEWQHSHAVAANICCCIHNRAIDIGSVINDSTTGVLIAVSQAKHPIVIFILKNIYIEKMDVRFNWK